MRKGLYFFLLLVSFSLWGCKENLQKEVSKNNVVDLPTTNATMNAVNPTYPTYVSTGYDSNQWLVDSTYINGDSISFISRDGQKLTRKLDQPFGSNDGRASVGVLYTEVTNADDIAEQYKFKPWYGLFKNGKGQLYIKATKVSLKPAISPYDDNDSTRYKDITTNNPDTCALLIGGIKGMYQGLVDTATITKNWSNRSAIEQRYDTLKFSLKGKEYSIETQQDTFLRYLHTKGAHWNFMLNYKVYLVGTKNGKLMRQLIRADNLASWPVDVLWINDVDGDGLPDLFLDVSCGHEMQTYGLYLSSLADKNELVKAAGSMDLID